MPTVADIARVCHEANRAWCIANDDFSQQVWGQAEDWQRQSAIKGVEFAIANPDAPDSTQHDAWMADKVAAGWVHGPEKNAEATPPTHPCLVPFDQLPEHQRKKDALFRAIVKALS